MYIEQMLDQVTNRDADQTRIEVCLGSRNDYESLFAQPAICRVLSELGPEALSDEALHRVAATLERFPLDQPPARVV